MFSIFIIPFGTGALDCRKCNSIKRLRLFASCHSELSHFFQPKIPGARQVVRDKRSDAQDGRDVFPVIPS
jgi:hypothetical protein